MISAIGAVPLVPDVDGAVEIGDGETPRDAWRGVPDLGGEFHQVQQERIKTIFEFHRDLDLPADIAVHPEAVVERFLLHLEVDIGCASPDSVAHHGRNELRHWFGVVRGDIEIMDAIVDILDVDRLKLGSTGAVVCGDGFDRSANFGRQRNNLYDLKVRETWCEVFLGKRAPWVCRRDDQRVLA